MPSSRLIKVDYANLASAALFTPPADADYVEIQVTSTIGTDSIVYTGGKAGSGKVLAKYTSGSTTPTWRSLINEDLRDGFQISGGSVADFATVLYYQYDREGDDQALLIVMKTILQLMKEAIERFSGRKVALPKIPPHRTSTSPSQTRR